MDKSIHIPTHRFIIIVLFPIGQRQMFPCINLLVPTWRKNIIVSEYNIYIILIYKRSIYI